MDIKKNDIVTVKIISLGYNGEGISKDLDKPIFVPFALEGEVVKVKIICIKKDFYIGKLEEILKNSPYRVAPKCSVYSKCGGCQLQHLSYDKQLEFKKKHIEDCFKKIAGIDIKANETVKSKDYEYRNKFSLPIGYDNEGNIVIGMYANNSHRIISIDNCIITESWNKEVISLTKKFIKEYKITAYNEITHKGLLKHLVARKVGKKISIILVINGKELPYKERFVEILKENLKYDFSFYININLLNNNVILGDTYKTIYGENPIDNFENILTEIHPNSFYQVNNEIKEKIYKAVLRNVQDNNVIDAYSGAGTISNYVAKYFKENKKDLKVYSVEIIPEAVEGAKKTSKLNNVEDIVNHNLGDCAKLVPGIAKEISNCVVIIDPPRKGCDLSVLEALNKANINKICYISCDPSTLARDVKILLNNYTINSLTPYDMFPNTKHIECVCILNRR